MSKKIFRSLMLVSVVVLLFGLVFTNGFLYDYYGRAQVARLKEELAMVRVGVEQTGAAYFEDFHSTAFRATLLSADGAVIYDSEVDAESMDNHRDREEIEEALLYGTGSSARYSATLTERTYYEAVRLSDGSILRLSTTQVTVASLIVGMLPGISAVILFSVVIAIVLSQRMARSIVKPLETLDLDDPNCNETYEELTPILSRLNRQHRQISEQMRELKKRSDEFRQIASSMQEGLILLDDTGRIVSINTAAQRLLPADNTAVGKRFLTVDRNSAVNAAVENALRGQRSDLRESRNGQEYQFIVTPIASDAHVSGVVVLCFDVTESVNAQRHRREFTANVSHELKTPLQSIIGSAELLESGLAKPEDAPRFVGNIKNEAERMVALINDIIRLSQLDEQTPVPMERVELGAVADEVCGVLRAAAEKQEIRLSVIGAPCYVPGVRRYLYEILYNLCDNAIRYNRPGGTVDIAFFTQPDSVVLQVSDSGIGIPPEHQSRIFERFYRVDKSHSRETGGTGLGLSIVKHAVAVHGGTVQLSSTVGHGTVVTVTLPRKNEE